MQVRLDKKKKLFSQNGQCVGHVCGTHVKLFNLGIVVLNFHIDMIDYDYDATFDDVAIVK